MGTRRVLVLAALAGALAIGDGLANPPGACTGDDVVTVMEQVMAAAAAPDEAPPRRWAGLRGQLLLVYQGEQGATAQTVTPTMAIDLHVEASETAVSSLGPTFYQDRESTLVSPLDPEVFGAEVSRYVRLPTACERFRGERRGVRIEKY